MKHLLEFIAFLASVSALGAITETVENKSIRNGDAVVRFLAEDLGIDVETFAREVTFSVAPRYPSELRCSGVPSAATIDMVVDDEGRVASAAVLHASHRAFGDEAMDAIRQWTFAPAMELGKTGPRQLRVRVQFVLVGTR